MPQNSLVRHCGPPCLPRKAIDVLADGVARALALAAPGVTPRIKVMLATAVANRQTALEDSTRNGKITNNRIQHNE